MEMDVSRKTRVRKKDTPGHPIEKVQISYFRACELACPVGSKGKVGIPAAGPAQKEEGFVR
jgi:hypothetical protein